MTKMIDEAKELVEELHNYQWDNTSEDAEIESIAEAICLIDDSEKVINGLLDYIKVLEIK